ncbi:hypothetical protein BV22DRAFT_1051198 [Leucogyrophana mollusca]|uniref:Uncharacterized protein n=1 Tax=Leucogyrophana mollusca TaxID=85980 RepID=A0ACB8B282_9AGAM|nr:hypothetical protein BV22DRAFT_1051198 [Leucogyrophana mollusca]
MSMPKAVGGSKAVMLVSFCIPNTYKCQVNIDEDGIHLLLVPQSSLSTLQKHDDNVGAESVGISPKSYLSRGERQGSNLLVGSSASNLFLYLLVDQLILVDTFEEHCIPDFFKDIKATSEVANGMLNGVKYDACMYYQLKSPVRLPADPDEETIRSCMDKSNWVELKTSCSLEVLGQEFESHYVYMAIKLPSRVLKRVNILLWAMLRQREEEDMSAMRG